MIVPYGPGGGYDTYTRLLAPALEKHLSGNANVVVQNVEGADGQIATEQVYAADADGYTNVILNLDAFSKQQVLVDVEYDLTKMSYYAQVAANIRSILIAERTGIETWDQFVAAVKNEELRFGSTGPLAGGATIPSVVGEVSGAYSGDLVRNNLVIYDGTAAIQQGMLSGDVDVLGVTYSSGLPYIESEGIRMFLVTIADETPPEQTPNADTLTSVGIDVDAARRIENTITANRVFAGPPDVPESRVETLRAAFKQAIQDEEFLQRAEEADRPVAYADGPTAAQTAQDKIATWQELRHLLE